MQNQTLIVIVSLALLAGCGGKGSGTTASGSTPAAAAVSGAAKAQQIQAGAADTAASSAKGTVAPAPALSQADGGELQAVAAAPDLVTGEKVYKGTCSICHRSGLKGAPRLGVKEDWESRLAQDKETLYDHAINGFRGKKGNMPSRGSNSRLSSEEVRAAVDYMVVHAVPSWSVGN